MKNVFFALLACLLTACFRVPHPSTFSIHPPAVPAPVTTEPSSPDRQAYASSDTVAAAAGSFTREAPVAELPTPPATVASRPASNPAAASGRSPKRALVRREVNQMLRTVLSGKHPVAARQDDPPPARNGMALASLILGVGGLVALLLSVVASAGTSGALAGVLSLLALISGILAAVFGGVAKAQIREGKGTQADRSRATAGMILGIVNMSIFALVILLALALILAWGAG
jgi:hypothetical protein